MAALLVILAVFNIAGRVRVRTKALEAMADDNPETAEENYDWELPRYVVTQASYDSELYDMAYESDRRTYAVVSWCREHDVSVPRKVRIDGRVYFAQEISWGVDEPGEMIYVTEIASNELGELLYVSEYEFSEDYCFSGCIYVDVTEEYGHIREVSLLFLAAALLVGGLGAGIGYHLGTRLEQSMLAEKRFFENASHELKTPLAAIRGYAEGLETGVITDPERSGRVIGAQTERMSRLIGDILCRARLESGSVPVRREPLDMAAFTQDCLMPFEGAVLNRGLELTLELEEGRVSADPSLLETALTNLLSNAVKYAARRIELSFAGQVFTLWNDTEPPLSDEDLAHLFDRFYIARQGGTGLGLSIARDIADLHGWRLTAGRDRGGLLFTLDMKQR